MLNLLAWLTAALLPPYGQTPQDAPSPVVHDTAPLSLRSGPLRLLGHAAPPTAARSYLEAGTATPRPAFRGRVRDRHRYARHSRDGGGPVTRVHKLAGSGYGNPAILITDREDSPVLQLGEALEVELVLNARNVMHLARSLLNSDVRLTSDELHYVSGQLCAALHDVLNVCAAREE